MRVTLAILLAVSAQAAVIGIDLGSEFFKSTLVEPGEQFKIVENTNSLRKTNTAICFTDEERIFEQDAWKKGSSLPQNSITDVMNYIGK